MPGRRHSVGQTVIQLGSGRELLLGRRRVVVRGIVDDIALTSDGENTQSVYLPFSAWPQLIMTLLVRQKVQAIDRVAFERVETSLRGKAWLGPPMTAQDKLAGEISPLLALRNLVAAFALIAVVMIAVTTFACQVLQMIQMRRGLRLRRFFGATRSEEVVRVGASTILPSVIGALVGATLATAAGALLNQAGVTGAPTVGVSLAAATIVFAMTVAFSGVVALWNTGDRTIRLTELQA